MRRRREMSNREEKLNNISTWAQGRFIDQRQYKSWSKEDKEEANLQESRLVRPYPLGNAICKVNSPDDAVWIADRLNLANTLTAKITDLESQLSDKAARVEELKETEQTLKKILSALVELKDHKDDQGKTEYYQERQPLAWAIARQALTNSKQDKEVEG